jgi:hypothetical protein
MEFLNSMDFNNQMVAVATDDLAPTIRLRELLFRTHGGG